MVFKARGTVDKLINRSETPNLNYEGSKKFMIIPRKNIVVDPKNQPRESYSETKYESLKRSISRNGIVQSLSVEYISGDRNNPEEIRVSVLDGFTRHRIAGEVDIEHIPCIVSFDRNESKKVIKTANTERSNLHPIEKGNMILLAIKQGDLDDQDAENYKEQLREQFSLSPNTARYYLNCARFIPQEVKQVLSFQDIRDRKILEKIVSYSKEADLKYFKSSENLHPKIKEEFESKVQKLIEPHLKTQEFDISIDANKRISKKKSPSITNLIVKEDGVVKSREVLHKFSADELEALLRVLDETKVQVLERLSELRTSN